MYRSDPGEAELGHTVLRLLDELLTSAATGVCRQDVIAGLLHLITDVLGFKEARDFIVHDEDGEYRWERLMATARTHGELRWRPEVDQLLAPMRSAATGRLTGMVVVEVPGGFEDPAPGLKARLDLLEIVVRQVGFALDAIRRMTHDPLTGLLNWTGVHQRLERLVAAPRDPGRPGVVMFCDLNGYKKFNDRFGHLVGDEVLTTVGRRIRSSVRESDSVGRYGGDEFVLVLPDIGRRQADEAARRVLAAVREPITLEEETLSVDASLGVVVVDAPASPREVLDHADQAMYVVKRGDVGERYVVHSLAGRCGKPSAPTS